MNWRIIIVPAIVCAALSGVPAAQAVEIQRPTINIPRPTINVPRPTINVPRVNIPHVNPHVNAPHIVPHVNTPQLGRQHGKTPSHFDTAKPDHKTLPQHNGVPINKNASPGLLGKSSISNATQQGGSGSAKIEGSSSRSSTTTINVPGQWAQPTMSSNGIVGVCVMYCYTPGYSITFSSGVQGSSLSWFNGGPPAMAVQSQIVASVEDQVRSDLSSEPLNLNTDPLLGSTERPLPPVQDMSWIKVDKLKSDESLEQISPGARAAAEAELKYQKEFSDYQKQYIERVKGYIEEQAEEKIKDKVNEYPLEESAKGWGELVLGDATMSTVAPVVAAGGLGWEAGKFYTNFPSWRPPHPPVFLEPGDNSAQTKELTIAPSPSGR